MKRIITAVATLLFGLAATNVSAQGGYPIKGVVVDALGPVIGATVMEQGTSNGTSTGIDGDYMLTVSSAEAMVEISCIGYVSQTFKATAVPARVTLMEDSQTLADVVVIGYGTVKKEDMTGSVSTVKGEDINKGVISSPADLLRGKSAGVVITSGSGMPGAGATIRIRGGSSLSATNDPLIVIDGLPVGNEGISGMSDPLSSINPNDIESFTVLKDASATAIYGSRASNGVIVITTKKGSRMAGRIPQISLDFQSSLGQVVKTVDVLDADQVKQLVSERYGKDSDAYKALGSSNTDWQKEIYQLAPSCEGNLSVNGCFGFGEGIQVPYRVSGGYLSQKGILKTSAMDRATLSLNLTPQFFEKHLTVNLNGKGTFTKNVFANQSAIGAATHMDPTQPIYDKVKGIHGYWAWRDLSGNVNTMATMNPVALLNEKKDNADAYRFIGNAQFDYKVHGFEDLRLNLNLGIDYATSQGIIELPAGSEESIHSTLQSGSGCYTDYDYSRNDQTLEFYAAYAHDFGRLHHFDAMAGYSWQHFWNDSHSAAVRMTDGSKLSDPYTFKTEYFLVSFFGRLNYSFAEKYLLTATVRRDGTSRFQNNKWGLFPSLAFAWNVKKEGFLKNLADLSTAKVRLSWGQTGQQDLNAGNYPTLATYFTNQSGSYYKFGGQVVNPISSLGYNADLKWETTTTYNGGFDLGFWNDRLTVSADAYYRKTTDLINYIPVAGLSNLTNFITTNIGDLENKGVELDLNAIPVSTQDVSWRIGVNAAYNRNKITKLTASPDDKTGVETGGIAGGTGNNVQMHQVGYPTSTFYLYQQIYDLDGKPIDGAYVDRNNDGQIDDNDRFLHHKPAADVTLGVNTLLTWKNWTLAASGHGSFGNWVYWNTASDAEMLADLWTNSFVSNRLATSLDSRFEQARYLSDYYLHDASFFKIDNVTLGYTFPKLFRFAERDASLNLFATIQNALILTKYQGIDPEVFGGIDNNLYPRPRTCILGLKLNF